MASRYSYEVEWGWGSWGLSAKAMHLCVICGKQGEDEEPPHTAQTCPYRYASILLVMMTRIGNLERLWEWTREDAVSAVMGKLAHVLKVDGRFAEWKEQDWWLPVMLTKLTQMGRLPLDLTYAQALDMWRQLDTGEPQMAHAVRPRVIPDLVRTTEHD